jgi:hypothetical protein
MRPEVPVAFTDMSAYLLLVLVVVVLWLFWAYLGTLFDAIDNYHRKAAADDKPRGFVSQWKER